MCGIAGYARAAGAPVPDLARMTALLRHRGPDEDGFYSDERVGLGMRRLSIIDLETGRQPVADESGAIQVVFNGEIYNYRELREELSRKGHRFRTQSDTEVLAHGYEEWGVDLPLRLRGMFAFAVWDSSKRRLFLARDPFGIKPLYVAEVPGCLLFASEMKSLLVHPGVDRDLDLAALDQYLSFLYVPEPATILRGVRALPPAHRLLWEDGRVRVERYWSLAARPPYPRYPEAVAAVREALDDSVRATMVSDVPVGLFLSGGLDSAAILAVMARHSEQPVRTFSLGFGRKERRWDELDAAGRLAARFGAQHRQFRVEPDVVRLLPKVLEHFDQPFANPTAALLYLLSGEARAHVKVALTGTGGDEMFAGYPRYLAMRAFRSYRRLPRGLRRGAATAARALLRDASDGRLGPQRLRRFLESGALGFEDCYVGLMSVLGEERKRSLYTPAFAGQAGPGPAGGFLRALLADGAAPEEERLMAADLGTYLPFNQLAYADRMGMARSIELRVPFVDLRVAEVASGIPLRWKTRRWTTKGLFRDAVAPLLPADVLSAPKLGLNLPVSLWFRGELREWLRDNLSPARLRARGLFQPEAVTRLIEEHEAGRRDHSLFLWALVALEQWRQHASAPPAENPAPTESLS